MMDIATLCLFLVAAASVLTVPLQMVRHLREDLNNKLKDGEKKFDRIVNQLEKVSDDMAKAHADYAAVNAKLDMLIRRGGNNGN